MSGIGTCCNSGGATPGGPVLLTAARTACPFATSSRQRTAPTKPDAPVTRMRMMSNRGDAASLFSLRRGILASLYLQAIRATTIRALSERKAEQVGVSFYPVILSGGSGSRLWPMSRRLLPKQFLPLVSEHSLLQDTVLRLRGLYRAGGCGRGALHPEPPPRRMSSRAAFRSSDPRGAGVSRGDRRCAPPCRERLARHFRNRAAGARHGIRLYHTRPTDSRKRAQLPGQALRGKARCG